MSPQNKTYTVIEYGGFSCERLSSDEKYQPLPEATFNALEKLILANLQENETDATELLSLSFPRGIGKTITAKNYVGVITMKDGTAIEILPKIGNKIGTDDTKKIFLKMLKTLKNAPFKDFNVSNLKTDRFNLLEIFISMFIREIVALTKQGLKSTYIAVEANERFFKGKLNVAQNIKMNSTNRARFFIRYDEWNINRPENRLLKSTLLFLQKKSQAEQNRREILHLLSFWEGVDYSHDYETDFSKCTSDRSMSHYEKALAWCKVFLRGNSFTSFAGKEFATALLFPMEKIFESYVATKLRGYLPADIEISTQDNRHHLFDDPKKFNLRPDIVLKKGDETVVIDTKWKVLLDNESKNYGISQADMYQMYAYSKKYNAKKVILLYPQIEKFHENKIITYRANSEPVNVEIAFIDLLQKDKESMQLLITRCFSSLNK